jgi:uncharacterized membrane protein
MRKGYLFMSSHKSLYQRILGPYRISHHPLCTHFEHHVYQIRGKKICRGCAMQYLGMFCALFIMIIGYPMKWWYGLKEIQIGVLLYLLIIPTVLTAFLIENRIIKDIARFLLGTSFSIAFVLLIFTPDWIIKIWILINFIPGYMYLNRRRIQKNEEVCLTCSEKDQFPYCSGYQIYADRENIFLTQAFHGGIHDPFSLPPDQIDD